jgi:NAD+ kinase
MLEDIAHFLAAQGCEVPLERDTAQSHRHRTTRPGRGAIGQQCDLAWWWAATAPCWASAASWRANLPLIGINQGRLGFITDIPLEQYREALGPMLRGDYEEDHRSLMHAGVWRDGDRLTAWR